MVFVAIPFAPEGNRELLLDEGRFAVDVCHVELVVLLHLLRVVLVVRLNPWGLSEALHGQELGEGGGLCGKLMLLLLPAARLLPEVPRLFCQQAEEDKDEAALQRVEEGEEEVESQRGFGIDESEGPKDPGQAEESHDS